MPIGPNGLSGGTTSTAITPSYVMESPRTSYAPAALTTLVIADLMAVYPPLSKLVSINIEADVANVSDVLLDTGVGNFNIKPGESWKWTGEGTSIYDVATITLPAGVKADIYTTAIRS